MLILPDKDHAINLFYFLPTLFTSDCFEGVGAELAFLLGKAQGCVKKVSKAGFIRGGPRPFEKQPGQIQTGGRISQSWSNGQ